jgi:hypothetical protein
MQNTNTVSKPSLSLEAIREARRIDLPQAEEGNVFNDIEIIEWGVAFRWFNTYVIPHRNKIDMKDAKNFSVVYNALKRAKEF